MLGSYHNSVVGRWVVVVLRTALSAVAVVCALCSGVRGDDLIGRNGAPTIRDVIVQFQWRETNAVAYWSLEDGLLWKHTTDSDRYQIDIVPDKLGAIKDRWKGQGVTMHIELTNSLPAVDLLYCSIRWNVDRGDRQRRRKNALPFTDHASIPLSKVERIYFMNTDYTGRLPLLVTQNNDTAFTAHLQDEIGLQKLIRNHQVLAQSEVPLTPVVSGFTNESDGAYGTDHPYFKEHEVPFPSIQKITITTGDPRANEVTQ
jgi:hypothetical protein